MSKTQMNDQFEQMTPVCTIPPPSVASDVKTPLKATKGVPSSLSPIRLTFAGGQLTELLALVPLLRRTTLCTTKGGFAFCFYQGCLVGGEVIEQQLIRLLDEPEATADLVSSDRLDDVLQGAVTIQGLLMDFAQRKDESGRND